MKSTRLLLLVATLAFCGCAVEEFEGEVAQKTTTLTIATSNPRTSLGMFNNGVWSLVWSEGDRLAANGKSSSEARISAEDAGQAQFSFEGDLSYPCNLLYPAQFYTDATTITLPATQEAATDKFATNTLPMAAVLAEKNGKTTMQHLMGAVCIQLLLAEESVLEHGSHLIKRVEFSGNNREQVSGAFEIDYTSATLTPIAPEIKANRTVKAKAERLLSTTEPVKIYVVVPAREYSSGFSIRILDQAGHYMDIKRESSITIHKGIATRLQPTRFVSQGTIIGAII